MNRPRYILGCLLVCSAAWAQQTRIVSITTNAVTWTNAQVGAYTTLEFRWDLTSPGWCPFFHWNVLTTGEQTSASIPSEPHVWANISVVIGTNAPPAFFRVVSSTQQMTYPVWTNTVTVWNDGTVPITNMSLALDSDTGPPQLYAIDTLLPSAHSDGLTFTQPMRLFVESGEMGIPYDKVVGVYFQTNAMRTLQFYPTLIPDNLRINDTTWTSGAR